MLGHTRPLSFPSVRYWYVFLCAGCAQLAGFEDFHGATVEDGESGAGGVTAPPSGGSSPANAGRSGGSSGRPGSGGTSDGGEPPRPEAGDTSVGDAGEGGATGSGGSLNGGAPSSGGVADTGGSMNGGSANGGNATGSTTASGGSPTSMGGTASGGSASGGSATGGKASDPCGQLLVNPAFASGSDGWTETSSYPDFVNNLHPIIAAGTDPELAALSVSPQSDDYLLWLGGIPDSNNTHTVMASQVVTLSPKLEELQFSVLARIDTAESDNEMFDNLYIELRAMDADESLVWQFIDRDNRDATSGWVELDPSLPDHSDIERFRGQTVTFMAYSRNDRENTTHFWLDSMSLRGLCNP
jgi:hypothetical protein